MKIFKKLLLVFAILVVVNVAVQYGGNPGDVTIQSDFPEID